VNRAVLILEFFEQAYRHRKERYSDRYDTYYRFKARNGDLYHVHFDHGSGQRLQLLTFRSERGGYSIAGGHRADALKVFSTVHRIIQRHVRDHPDLQTLTFSASEPSRVKLYRHMAKHFATKHKEDQYWGGTKFSINRSDLKDPSEYA